LYLLSHFADKVAWVCLFGLQLMLWGGAGIMAWMAINTEKSLHGNENSQRVFGGSAY